MLKSNKTVGIQKEILDKRDNGGQFKQRTGKTNRNKTKENRTGKEK
jgi:hypothetical protein